MNISSLYITGFRNFKDAVINFNQSTLLIGSNDVGKSNLLHTLRILLDRSLSESDIEPTELDFHISSGEVSDKIIITISFQGISEDAVLSILKGYVSDDGKSFLRYEALRSDLSYRLFIGHSLGNMEEIDSRFYLKYINLRYVHSQRDLNKFIQKEKRHLLSLAQKNLGEDESSEDSELLSEIGDDLVEVNEKVSQLYYVTKATDDVNNELKKLAYHYSDYTVRLDSGAIQVNQFIEKLQLGAKTNGSSVMLGGDGRNNQILLALWKAKSVREHDKNSEVVFYVVEEPEAHLHPHQQRKLAEYLNTELPGQSIISSHSPQIASSFRPDSIIRLIMKESKTIAASDGCSDCVSDSWDQMGYRISILPAEAFYSSGVMLVEGPSEMLFYKELSHQIGIDLDYFNISLLSVDGVSFEVYIKILDAMHIPWVIRTDNDVSKVSGKNKWQYAGINRCYNLLGLPSLNHENELFNSAKAVSSGKWKEASQLINNHGIFLSKIDLETDLAEELPEQILEATGKDTLADAVAYLQKKKAIRMRALLKTSRNNLHELSDGELAKPLHHIKKIVGGSDNG